MQILALVGRTVRDPIIVELSRRLLGTAVLLGQLRQQRRERCVAVTVIACFERFNGRAIGDERQLTELSRHA